jgi:hypothetical protein
MAAGLVKGEGFAVGASLIAVDANKRRSIAGSEWIKERDLETASRAVKEIGDPRRRGFWRCHQGNAEVRLAVRSGRPMDRRDAGTGIFCIFR